MYLFVTSMICILPCTYGITINTPTDKDQAKSASNQDKRSLLIGDLSYSYAATDIGSDEGSHIKTITVIKNIAAPTYKKSPHHPYDEWDDISKNRFNFVFKLPEFPQIGGETFFHREERKKVVPTKQPTDRQTPVFDPQFNTNSFGNQPNFNKNNDQNVPQVYDVSQSENDPEPLPDPMTILKTDGKDGQTENPMNKEASDEVEYIQTDGEQSKMTMPKGDMLHSKTEQSSRVPTSNGYRISNGRKKTNEHKQQSQRHSTEFVEDFSDYSMHNVKHLVDPNKVKDSLLKYTQNQSNLDLKKLSAIDPTKKDQKYDSYGNIIEKSQSLLDASESSHYGVSPKLNIQPSKRPYISPSLKKPYDNPSSQPPAKVKVDYSTTSSKGLVFFSTTQKAYTAPKNQKSSKTITPNPDHYFVKTSTDSIQQPTYSLQINDGNHEQMMLQYEFQPQPAHLHSPYKQANQQHDKKPEQQFQSYSIRNPLTTSIPVQHNRQESPKLQPKLQSYIAVPLEANTQPYSKEGSKQHMPKRYVRHHIVFNSKPPHAFMESPFKPVKTILIG